MIDARWMRDCGKALCELGGEEHARTFEDLAEASDDPALRVVVFGEFSAGKSTLINALLGRRVLPSKARPTTGHVTYIVHGRKDEVRVAFTDGRVERCALAEIDRFGVLDIHSRAHEGIERLEIRVACPLLAKGLILLDTPGVNDAEEQTTRARRAVSQADLILFVLNAQQLLSTDQRKLAVGWMAKELGKPVVPVLNFLNQVESAEQDDVRRILDSWAQAHLSPELERPFFEVNALGALRHAIGVADAARPIDDFAVLRDALDRLTGRGGMALRHRSRARGRRAATRAAAAWNRNLLERLQADRHRVILERAAQRDQLIAARSRISQAAARERAHAIGQAAELFRQGFRGLADLLKGGGKSTLENHADGWLDDNFRTAIKAAEHAADEGLKSLARSDAPTPTPMTAAQLVTLDERADVHIEYHDNSEAVAVGGLAAAAAGFMVAGPVGAFVAWLAGSWLTETMTVQEPDYGAAYTKAAEQNWDKMASRAKDLLSSQFDGRVAEMLAALDGQLRSLESLPETGRELHLRQQLAQRLAGSEDDGGTGAFNLVVAAT